MSKPELDESNFIRSKLFAGDKSQFVRYRELVFRDFSWPKLLRYELLTTFIGPLSGALGLMLRKHLYRGLFRQAGKGIIFGRNLTLHHADRITLGDGVVIDQECVLDARGAGETGIVIGNRVIVNRGAAIQSKAGSVEIGDDCNIGAGAELIAQGSIVLGTKVSVAGKAMIAGGRYVVEQEDDAPGAKHRFSDGPIHVGDNTRIGMGAIIQDGITIGENAIIAPGSVVYESVSANTVVWGNPARAVRNRSSSGPVPAASTENAIDPSVDQHALRQAVCAYLEGDLFIEFGPDSYATSDSLLEAGIMDSLALVRLLQWIEAEFELDLDFSSLDPSDIDSVEKIVARITRLGQ